MIRMKSQKDLDSYVENYLIRTKKSFLIEKKNGYTRVTWGDNGNLGIYFREKTNTHVQRLLWIYSAVKKNVNKYLEENGNRVDSLDERYRPIRHNRDMINSMKKGTTFLSLDLSHAYFRVAYNLGYISAKLYDKVMDYELSKEYIDEDGSNVVKVVRNKSLSVLVSARTVETFIDGEIDNCNPVVNMYYRELYADIRNRCYKVFSDLMDDYPKDILFYKTDCVYFKPKLLKIVKERFKKYNLLYGEVMNCQHNNNTYYETYSSKKNKLDVKPY